MLNLRPFDSLKRAGFPLLVVLLLLTQSVNASADAAEQIRVEVAPGHGALPGLAFEADPALEISEDENAASVVRIKGRFVDQEGSSLVARESRIRIETKGQDGELEIEIPVVAERNTFSLSRVNEFGTVDEREYVLVVPGWAPAKPTPSVDGASAARAQAYSVSLGGSLLEFEHPGIIDFSSTALTLKGSAAVPVFSDGWSFGSTAYVTLLTLSSNTPGVSLRFLGWNLRLGRGFPVGAGWTAGIFGGLYYSTTLASGRDFGFEHLYGPQLFVTLRKDLGGSEVSAYGKLAPVADRIALLSLASRELAAGGSWKRPFRDRHALSVNLDYSRSQLSVAGITATGSSLSLALGFHW